MKEGKSCLAKPLKLLVLTFFCSSQHNTDIALKKSLIEKKLEESGEKAKLEEYLRQKLIECGWKDELKKYCLGKFIDSKLLLDLIRNKGLEKINLDDLVEDLLPKGRALVPTKVKEDLLARIKHYLESDPDYKRLTGF